MPASSVIYNGVRSGRNAKTETNISTGVNSDVGRIYPQVGESVVNQQQPTPKMRTVKVGKRTFEVKVCPNTTVFDVHEPVQLADEREADQLRTERGRFQENNQQRANVSMIDERRMVLATDDQLISQAVRPRRRKNRRKPANSIESLPVSTISAFSAFSKTSKATGYIPPKRTKFQLLMNSFIMFGREFCYAVEAGLTTPILLSIGLPSNMYSLVWVISPILGFILQPVVGNLSDRCSSRWGRRRPFILGLALLLLIGITFFLNGEQIVSLFDTRENGVRVLSARAVTIASITVTIVGVVIFDFSADFIEGPIRAYSMDVCDEDDVKVSLLYQAVLTGAGGAFGYASGAVPWTRSTPLGRLFPTDRQVIFTIASCIFIVTCACNLISIPEKVLKDKKKKSKIGHHHTDVGIWEEDEDASERLIGDVNRNFPKKQHPRDLERDLLHSLMRQKRNQLFEEFEGNTEIEFASLAEKQQYEAANKLLRNIHKRGIKKRTGRRRPSSSTKKSRSKSKSPTSKKYGTFSANGGFTNPNHEVIGASTNKVSFNGFTSYDDVLSARQVYTNMREEKQADESYSSDSSDATSIDFVMTKSSPLMAIDAGVGINTRHVTSLDGDVFEHATAPVLESPRHSKKILKYDANDIVSDHWEDDDVIARANQKPDSEAGEPGGLKSLIRSISTMPKDLRYLCVCHLFGWIAFLCMALFFTDFVGQEVMGGDPRAPPNSRLGSLYREGVEYGNWGLTINAAASSIYCVFLKPLIGKFGPRAMYVFGYLTFGIGACVVAIFQNVYVVLTLSSVIGIMSATLYTLPYLLVAQYHEGYKSLKGTSKERGIGTDCALVTCMIQLAQIFTGLGVGALVNWLDTVTVTVATSSVVAFAGTIWAAFLVRY